MSNIYGEYGLGCKYASLKKQVIWIQLLAWI